MKKLLYTSRRADAGPATLDAILAVSRRRNRADGITGVLLYDDRRYLQLLEGDHDALARCFLRIAMHPAHREIAVIAFEDSAVRLFSGWDMHDIAAAPKSRKLATLWRDTMACPEGQRAAAFEAQLYKLFPAA